MRSIETSRALPLRLGPQQKCVPQSRTRFPSYDRWPSLTVMYWPSVSGAGRVVWPNATPNGATINARQQSRVFRMDHSLSKGLCMSSVGRYHYRSCVGSGRISRA